MNVHCWFVRSLNEEALTTIFKTLARTLFVWCHCLPFVVENDWKLISWENCLIYIHGRSVDEDDESSSHTLAYIRFHVATDEHCSDWRKSDNLWWTCQTSERQHKLYALSNEKSIFAMFKTEIRNECDDSTKCTTDSCSRIFHHFLLNVFASKWGGGVIINTQNNSLPAC